MAGTDRIRKTRKLALIVIAATSTAIVAVAGPVRAGLAPTAVAKGTAVAARPLDTGVGIATASAGEDGAASEAVGVRALGRDVAATRSNGNDTRERAAVSTRVPLTTGRVEVMPRGTSADSSGDEKRSAAHTDLVTARIPSLVALEVLSSDAEAAWTPRSSWSRSQTDGAKLDLFEGGLIVVLMHAEGNSDGSGRLYLVRINNATFVDSVRGNQMTLSVPDIFTIQLLHADARGGRFTGQVLKTAWLDGTSLDQFAAAVDATGGSADAKTETFALSATSDDGTSESDETLPMTGSPIVAIVLAALTLIEAGAAMTLVRTARARA